MPDPDPAPPGLFPPFPPPAVFPLFGPLGLFFDHHFHFFQNSSSSTSGQNSFWRSLIAATSPRWRHDRSGFPVFTSGGTWPFQIMRFRFTPLGKGGSISRRCSLSTSQFLSLSAFHR